MRFLLLAAREFLQRGAQLVPEQMACAISLGAIGSTASGLKSVAMIRQAQVWPSDRTKNLLFAGTKVPLRY